MGLRILQEATLVFLVLLPREIAGVHIREQDPFSAGTIL
jgi:hypothetical protein